MYVPLTICYSINIWTVTLAGGLVIIRLSFPKVGISWLMFFGHGTQVTLSLIQKTYKQKAKNCKFTLWYALMQMKNIKCDNITVSSSCLLKMILNWFSMYTLIPENPILDHKNRSIRMLILILPAIQPHPI